MEQRGTGGVGRAVLSATCWQMDLSKSVSESVAGGLLRAGGSAPL